MQADHPFTIDSCTLARTGSRRVPLATASLVAGSGTNWDAWNTSDESTPISRSSFCWRGNRDSQSALQCSVVLILYLLIKTSQEQCISLGSRSGNGRNPLLWMENGSKGLVLCNEPKPPPIEVYMYMELFHPPHNGQCLLVNLCILVFCLGQRSGCKSLRPLAAIRHDVWKNCTEAGWRSITCKPNWYRWIIVG